MDKKILFLGLFMIIFAACGSPPEDMQRAIINNEVVEQNNIELNEENLVPINPSNSHFEFQGYGPGRDHIGTFEVWDGFFIIENDQIVGAYGTIDPATVETDSSGLDRHLKSSDFFDVEQFPEITIRSKSISDGSMTAELYFHGVRKDINFPVEIDHENYSISSEFILSMGEFGISYTGVNDEVRIQFDFRN